MGEEDYKIFLIGIILVMIFLAMMSTFIVIHIQCSQKYQMNHKISMNKHKNKIKRRKRINLRANIL